jgi:uncharacterized membrane protein YgaE (UPF0421/DUF939 family)
MGLVDRLVRGWKSPWGFGPRVKLALKAALAAGVAWQLAQLVPGSIAQYAYYAPLGAVLAMYPTLVSSVRAAGQTVLGIVLGATIAHAVDHFLPANAFTVALLLGAGILAGGLRWLGEQRSWVPMTALFVFTIGEPGSISYVAGYVGLTLLGVVVGTLVNFLVFPPLHLRQSEEALRQLRDIVCDQLEDLAEGLEHNEAPDEEGWRRRTRSVSPMVSSMRQALSDLDTSERGNPRARRYRRLTREQERQGQAFQRMALLVEDLVTLLTEVEEQHVAALPFNNRTRLECAAAMRRLADLARSWGGDGDVDPAITAACDAVERLERSVAEDPNSGDADPFVAGSMVTTLRRCLGAMVACGGSDAVAAHQARLFR